MLANPLAFRGIISGLLATNIEKGKQKNIEFIVASGSWAYG